jgi:hypothetical protein
LLIWATFCRIVPTLFSATLARPIDTRPKSRPGLSALNLGLAGVLIAFHFPLAHHGQFSERRRQAMHRGDYRLSLPFLASYGP